MLGHPSEFECGTQALTYVVKKSAMRASFNENRVR
jgi:hypothetical protein